MASIVKKFTISIFHIHKLRYGSLFIYFYFILFIYLMQ